VLILVMLVFPRGIQGGINRLIGPPWERRTATDRKPS